MDKMTIYNHLPIIGQNLACCLEGYRIKRTRYGYTFWNKLEEYESHNTWSYEQKCEYRDLKIREMIQHCYKTVPYYHEMFNECGIDPESIKNLDSLKVLPILTKEIVNKNPESFLSSAMPRERMITAHTSGTTGSGFIFKTTQDAICSQWAVWWRYRRKLGIQFGTLSGNFGTRFIVPAYQRKPPFWRYNIPCSQVYFSAFHEKPEYLRYYLKEIRSKGITWLHGYPSLLSELAIEALKYNDDDINKQIKFVTIGAENLLEHQRTIIEKAFGVHVYQHYGLSEGVANFSENTDKLICVDEDFAATEFIEHDGITNIIGTNLNNYAMPLLRWNTKDTAVVEEIRGVGRVVKSLDGRIEDYITLPSGKKIGKLDHVFKDAIHLKEVQIQQKKDYSIKVLYVPSGVGFEDDLKETCRLFKSTFGEPVNLKYEKVDSINKTKSGKIRFIQSEIK